MLVRPTLHFCSRSIHKQILPPCRLLRVRYNSSTANAAQLPSAEESSRSRLSKTISSRGDKLQTSLLFAGQRLNDLTGYSGIERLKNQIEAQERHVSGTIERVREAKRAYEEAIRTRSESQREVNELLQRKSSWSSSDLERFTTLFRNDHSNSRNEEQAQRNLGTAELEVDRARTTLGNMILARYHEEQIWSDKIRRASTWGTWGLMGFNIFLFVLVQLGLEPWKRKRLVGSFEDKVRQVVQEEREALRDGQGLQLPVATGRDFSQIPEENMFLTDADYAAAPIEHYATPRTAEPANMINNSASGIPLHVTRQTSSISDSAITKESSQPTSTLVGRPRAGLVGLLYTPLSLEVLRHAGHTGLLELQRIGLTLVTRARDLWRSALSPDRSHLRVEDVTSACLASGLFGIAIGLCFRR